MIRSSPWGPRDSAVARPRFAAQHLEERNLSACHVADLGHSRASDREIIELLHLVTSDPAEFLPPRICFEAVLEAAPVLVVSLDESGQVCLDTHEYRKLLGELRGQAPIEVLCQALREQAGFDPLELLRAGRRFKDVEISIELPGGGPRWFSYSGTLAGEAGSGERNHFGRHRSGARHLLLLANDITIRRREIERAHSLPGIRAFLHRLAQPPRAGGCGARADSGDRQSTRWLYRDRPGVRRRLPGSVVPDRGHGGRMTARGPS